MQELVQFHPSYSYEDFVTGIRPVSREGVVEYPMQDGRFLDFCRKARVWRGTCVLVIDEINRADISRAFGELMYLLEYRDRTIELAGGSPFRIPGNVRIIGTMNTADRSIALLDYALRRRFAFIELRPDYGLLRRYHARYGQQVEGLIGILERMNSRINNPHYELGISFFLHPNLPELLPSIWEMEIEPYLAEYFYDQPAAVEEFRWEKVKEGMEME
ncbi:MAG: 5-methylcytosine-specific restriction enzyme B [Chlorobi bacterium OLB7]|nr:MAG: 5-methylcytosine-specific restriction enzyme B [Chlorobi bacterium OLB7]